MLLIYISLAKLIAFFLSSSCNTSKMAESSASYLCILFNKWTISSSSWSFYDATVFGPFCFLQQSLFFWVVVYFSESEVYLELNRIIYIAVVNLSNINCLLIHEIMMPNSKRVLDKPPTLAKTSKIFYTVLVV